MHSFITIWVAENRWESIRQKESGEYSNSGTVVAMAGGKEAGRCSWIMAYGHGLTWENRGR
jgi:hypothetical protein